jgi:hypothetical protein
MAETTTSPNEYRVMPTAELQKSISQTEFLSTRPTVPASGFYRDGTMSPYARRKMRMQEDWDKRYEMMINQEEAARKFELDRRQAEIYEAREVREQAKYLSEIDEARAQAKVDSEIETQRARFDSGLAELDPRLPDFLDNFAKLSRENRLALETPSVQKLASQYLAINEIYRAGEETDAASAEAAKGLRDQKLSQLTKLAKLTGRNLSDLAQSDIETEELIVDPVAVGEAEAELATKPPVDPNLPVYRREASKLREQVRQLDSKILANQVDVRGAKTERAKEEFEQNIRVLTAQRDNLYAEYVGVEELLQEGAGATGEAEITDAEIPRLTTEDKEAYDALPAGAVFYMNGRRGRKPEKGPQDEAQSGQPQTPAPTATPAATTGVNLAPPTAPQPIQAPTGPTTRQSSAQEQLAEIDRILASNASPTEKAVAASRRADLQNIVRGEEAGAQTRQQTAQAQTSEQLVSWRNNIVNTVTDKDWMGTVQGPKSGVDPNDYFLTIKDAFDQAPAADPREYVGLLSLIVGRRGPTGIVTKKKIDPELKEAVFSEIRRVIEESDAGANWQGQSRKPNFNWQRIVPAEALKKPK